MILTKWFQGKENLEQVMEIRKNVFLNEMNLDEELISDFYDEFAFNLVAYEDEIAVGTGRLIFKESKYFLDKICVIKDFRGKCYEDLIIRMLVRKAINIKAEETYSYVEETYQLIFNKIGFKEISRDENNNILMMKIGDVGGNC